MHWQPTSINTTVVVLILFIISLQKRSFQFGTRDLLSKPLFSYAERFSLLSSTATFSFILYAVYNVSKAKKKYLKHLNMSIKLDHIGKCLQAARIQTFIVLAENFLEGQSLFKSTTTVQLLGSDRWITRSKMKRITALNLHSTKT